jgi:trk system potassium uptake protein TrkA
MKKFAVIGIGKFGFYLAKTLQEDGHDVVVIDRDRERVSKIKPFCSHGVVADATNKEVISSLGLAEKDAVIISTGEDMAASILMTMYVKELGVKDIAVKAVNEDHASILEKVGATRIIFPEKDIAIKAAKSLSIPNLTDFIPISEEFVIVEIAPPPAFLGKSIRELDLRNKYRLQVVAIKEGEPPKFHLVPSPDRIIKSGDRLAVVGKHADIGKVKEMKK